MWLRGYLFPCWRIYYSGPDIGSSSFIYRCRLFKQWSFYCWVLPLGRRKKSTIWDFPWRNSHRLESPLNSLPFVISGFIIPQRVVLAIMGFLAIVNAYTMRICLSVAITEMVKKTTSNHSVEIGETCPASGDVDESTATGEFEWDEELQGLILSAFYWGYVITHLPGGMLAERFGGKYTLSLGILSTAIFTLLTPLCIEWGKWRRCCW